MSSKMQVYLVLGALSVYIMYLSYLDIKYRRMSKLLLLPALGLAITFIYVTNMPRVLIMINSLFLFGPLYLLELTRMRRYIRENNLTVEQLDEHGYRRALGAVDILFIPILGIAAGSYLFDFLLVLLLVLIVCKIIGIRKNVPLVAVASIAYLIFEVLILCKNV